MRRARWRLEGKSRNPERQRSSSTGVKGGWNVIFATGASGNVGGQVLAALLRERQPVKALYRSEKDAAGAPSAVQTAIADFADAAAMQRALEGIKKVYLVCAPVPQLIE